jgi:hypothetical protein
MAINMSELRDKLQQFRFKELFNDLGWDRLSGRPLALEVHGVTFYLTPVAEKRGFQVFECISAEIPDHATRMKLERELARQAYEHLVVFSDQGRTQQVWQWTRREPGKQFALRTTRYAKGTSGDVLLQKLTALAVSIAEEEAGLGLTDVVHRAKKAFDVEKVTKRFYEQFQREHQSFFARVSGLPEEARRWYTSLMLNRLMFVYFVQKKGFLDGNPNYLRDRLHKVQALRGKGKFHSFYRDFLLALFHDGLGSQQRPADPELRALLGTIPYLNGGLFEIHPLEAEHAQIQIPDEAFEQVFAFFEQYQWHLDDRPLREGNEINPDVLGYIFEKYINQKQMGAYYTKEDITEYIAKNTILPHVLETTRQGCRVAFEGQGSLWKLLPQDPDRYIYEAVRRGADYPEEQLPEFVQKGMHDPEARMFDKRYNLGQADLNDAEGNPLTLPTETWREYITRRQRYHSLKAKLSAGQVQNVADLITLNLNLRQFAQDVLDSAEGADLVRAYWKALTEIKILDPTCGSGAFLFAALNILQPLYDSALDKMEALVSEADAAGSTQKYPDFRRTLAEVSKHPSERYYVLKSIVVNNLYGVDIMEEATEIAKLRLFLKLMSQIEHPGQLEPLPDIDFNIRAGNALVGFATLKEISDSFSGRLDYGDFEREITEKLDDLEALFRQFRLQQTTHGGPVTPADKQTLRQRLQALEEELNRHLAAQYGIDPKKPADYQKWKASHKPFHWFVDFYGIMKNGGFDAIIGNPPYVEYAKVKQEYRLPGHFLPFATNLYSACCYRSFNLRNNGGFISFIVPVSFPSTDRMQPLRRLLTAHTSVWQISFSTRPSKLFEGAEQRLTVYIQAPSTACQLYSGGYLKWSAEERKTLFDTVSFVEVKANQKRFDIWPKIRSREEVGILEKLDKMPTIATTTILGEGSLLFYKNTGLRYFNTVTLRPPKCWINGHETSSSRETKLSVLTKYQNELHCILLSTSFFLYYQAMSNCRDLNPADIQMFPIPSAFESEELDTLSVEIETDYVSKGRIIRMNNKLTGLVELESLSPAKSKPIIDQIDRVLAQHYGFTPEELDFIINYDIKYRMGRDALDGD